MSTPRSSQSRVRHRGPVAAVLAAVLLLGGSTVVHADDLDDRRAAAEREQQAKEAERESLESELEHTDTQLADAVLELNQVEGRLPVAEAELAEAEAELERAEREAAILAQRLADAQLEEAKVSQQLQDGSGKVDGARDDIAQMAREEFRGAGNASAIGLVTGAQSTKEFIDGYSVSSSAARIRARTLAELQDAEATARNLQARLSAIREAVTELKRLADENVRSKEQAKQAAVERKAEIERLIEEQERLKARIERRKHVAVENMQATEQELSSIESDLKSIIREQRERDERLAQERAEREAEEGASRGGSSGGGSSGGGSSGGGSSGGGASGGGTGTVSFLGYPTASPLVTSSYGMRFHPVLQYSRLHAGTDFRAYCGTPILAPADGTVLYARFLAGLGNQVLINHGYSAGGSSVMTSSNHLTSFAVSPGQSVSRGQVIGYSGTTGTSTACHLHFEVYVDGSTVDPMTWL
ncbi:peptidoglycan DD-metalloendopeptidase family protein [Promicromonospora iranensis]|uniref:Murein DD-endopeptidase MepM/ murein hydrolase activator NlpD n=1 Tax=Promicromonospora iranensis TaxID=1105144 RepID=A0ABU2CKZ4_9MICO|nr:peptidoglycan DD-metalloendopeptidase family protein [Promicromonospora iranensis]MDR7382001.1 murein DD-endopeptidase MepM/ murein hydrolase activator NlpD [Promicromonospora iranensis]